MKLLRAMENMPGRLQGAVLAIGNFDGVHRGHLAVLDQARLEAEHLGAPWGVLTFEPHPRVVLRPEAEHFCLTPLALKARLLEYLGPDVVIAAPFDAALSNLSAEQFITRMLIGQLKARHVVIGWNFRFGKARKGDADMLEAQGRKQGLGVTVAAPARQDGDDGVTFSSSAVRDALRAGDPRAAADILGHWWQIAGTVERGDRRGHEIGYPTANIALKKGCGVKHGIYAVRVREIVPDGFGPAHGGAASIGLRPMFALDEPRLEVFLFDFSGDLYGRELLVELIAYLRPERNFDDLDALKAAIGDDCKAARAHLAALERGGDPMSSYPIGRAFAP